MSVIRKKLNIEQSKLHTFAVLTLLVVCFTAYIYFLSMSVVHVIIRKEVNNEIALLQSEIGMLESAYIKQQHAVSNEIVSRTGYVAVTDKIFLDRSDTSLVLSANQR
ncbi:MAG: hypothetical protein WDZ68_00830 [Candidatus Paceibacterota bacterium]